MFGGTCGFSSPHCHRAKKCWKFWHNTPVFTSVCKHTNLSVHNVCFYLTPRNTRCRRRPSPRVPTRCGFLYLNPMPFGIDPNVKTFHDHWGRAAPHRDGYTPRLDCVSICHLMPIQKRAHTCVSSFRGYRSCLWFSLSLILCSPRYEEALI